MNSFKDYEIKVLHLLTSSILSPEQLESVVHEGEVVSLEYTGCGYFLSITHPDIPTDRIVCSEPHVTGCSGDTNSGFVVFIENNVLTLECYSLRGGEIAGGFRDCNVQIASS
jgi:hypothetical protein